MTNNNHSRSWMLPASLLTILLSVVVYRWQKDQGPQPIDQTPTQSPAPTVRPVAKEKKIAHTETQPPVDDRIVAPPPLSPDRIDTWSDLEKKLKKIGAIENEANITFKSPEERQAFLPSAQAAGLRIKLGPDGQSVNVGYDDLAQLKKALTGKEAGVENIGPNYLIKVPTVPPPDPNNPGGQAPVGDQLMSKLGLQGVDNRAFGAGIKVAVIDSGIAANHPEFRGTKINNYDYLGTGEALNGHGTAMAGLIKQISPSAEIGDFRIAGENGESDSFLLTQAIYDAVNRGYKVINMSMASYGYDPSTQRAIKYGQSRGVTFFAAAGNEAASILAYPAGYEGVYSVSAIDDSDKLAYFSNSGSPTLSAYGVGIESPYVKDHEFYHVLGQGTSQASAIAAGLATAYISQGRPANTIISTAQPAVGTPAQIGAGRVSYSR